MKSDNIHHFALSKYHSACGLCAFFTGYGFNFLMWGAKREYVDYKGSFTDSATDTYLILLHCSSLSLYVRLGA